MKEDDYSKFLEHSKTTHAMGRVGTVDEVCFYVVKTSLNSTWGAIGPKLSVIHRLTDKHTNSLFSTFRQSTA